MKPALKTISPGLRNSRKPKKAAKVLEPGAEIVVVGAGAFGSWTALNLLEQGFKVTLIDAWGPGNSRSSSGGETRVLRAIYGQSKIYTQLTVDAIHLWPRYQEEIGEQLFYPTGVLWLSYQKDNAVLDPSQKLLSKAGLPFQIFDKSALKNRYSILHTSDLCYGVLEINAGYLKANRACLGVTKLFEKKGGKYLSAWWEPTKLAQRLRSIRLSTDEELKADLFIFACGPWLKQLFPEILSDYLKITRQEVHYFGVPQASTNDFRDFPCWIDLHPDNVFYGIPGDLQRGFKIAHDVRGPQINPTSEERIPSKKEISASRSFLANRFPVLKGSQLVEARVCQYSNTLDGNLILDYHPHCENALLLGGGSGHGFKYGPAFGKLVTDIVKGSQLIPVEFQLA